MVSLEREHIAHTWSLPLPWTAKVGMTVALAFLLSIVLFMH